MQTLKKYCEKNGLDINKMFDMVLAEGGNLLPKKTGIQGYIVEITDASMICSNEKLGVKKEIPFSSFTSAEFGIGSGQLWLQCVVDNNPFVFCTTRGNWKAPSGKLLLEKISQHTEILDMKEYDRYTGKLFLWYAFVR